MDHIDGGGFMAASDGSPHVTTSADLLDFGGGEEEIYMGQVPVRGILCDYWTSSQNSTYGNVTSFFEVGMYFSAESWSIPEAEGEHEPALTIALQP